MRKMIAVLTSVLMIFTLAACGRNESKQSMPEDVDISGVDAAASASIVVRDGERQGNTEYAARIIQETVGCDPPRDRSLITVSSLMASGILDTSLLHHIQRAKENGVTREEMAEALTQLAFYAGWPKAWAALRMAKEVYNG